jgi:bacillithiol biosynthesis cysteine-adding enzyme BshC
MIVDKLSFAQTGKFSNIFLDYIASNPKLSPFINQQPSLGNLNRLANEKEFSKDKRIILQKILQQQYAGLTTSKSVDRNLLAFEYSNVYTVTTGHQLNIFTGPLYFIYKIVTTINLAKTLNEKYPDKHFVPVYWMASEDHDFEEISYFHLFGKKYQWQTDQTGAVGRFRPESLSKVLSELPESVELFEKAYLDQNTLAQSARYYINELFGEDGLIVIDSDNSELKSLFRDVMQDDIFKHTANGKLENTSQELQKIGYSPQINPREINFFFLKDNIRERIVREGEVFKVLNTDISFSEQEMEAAIQATPECFSPNVVLRPVYQETILPNIAYIGGPSELAYWFQLKDVFDHYNVAFPALIPRNFALYINKVNSKKLDNLKIEISDLFKSHHELKSIQLKAVAENDLEINAEKEVISNTFDIISQKAASIDKSLTGFIAATHAKIVKDLENIEKRLKKGEEKNQETHLAQVESIKDKLFPNDSLQERYENFLTFYINNPHFINELKRTFDPLDFQFLIIKED